MGVKQGTSAEFARGLFGSADGAFPNVFMAGGEQFIEGIAFIDRHQFGPGFIVDCMQRDREIGGGSVSDFMQSGNDATC